MEIREVFVDQVDVDENNPREDMGDLAALAATFDAGPYPGEPINPIVVAADGGRYRIVDGERRFRAMRDERGLTRCHAVVCDGVEDVAAASAMVASDDKKPLDAIEMSRGVQQMLMLGVQPDVVDRVSRRRGSRYVRAAMAGSEWSRTRQLGLDQLQRVGELMSEGRDADARALSEADPERWSAVADQLDREARASDAVELAKRALSEAGVAFVESDSYGAPDGHGDLERLEGVAADGVREGVGRHRGEVEVASIRSDPWSRSGAWVTLWGHAEDDAPDPEEARRDDAVTVMEDRVGQWIDWAEGEMMAAVADLAPNLGCLARRVSQGRMPDELWDEVEADVTERVMAAAEPGGGKPDMWSLGAFGAARHVMEECNRARTRTSAMARAIVDGSTMGAWAFPAWGSVLGLLDALSDDGMRAEYPGAELERVGDLVESAVDAAARGDGAE